MKKALYTLVLFILFCPLGVLCKEQSQRFSIKAFFTPSGPYEGIWNINIVEFPDSSGGELKFTRQVGLAGTRFSGEAFLKRDKLTELKSGLSESKFFDLPENISADLVALHMPDYFLEICSESECKKVSLYDPKSLEKSKESIRFILMWNLVMNSLPKWPADWPSISSSKAKQ